MKKLISMMFVLLLAGCAATPESVTYQGKVVGTYSGAAGCGTLKLDQDCSQISGATREIEIDNIKLRVSGGDEGKNIFVMSMPKFLPDEGALDSGARSIQNLFEGNGIEILDTKVMYGSGRVFGVHYTLDKDGYSLLQSFTVTDNS